MEYNVYVNIPVMVTVEANDEDEAMEKAVDLQDEILMSCGGYEISGIEVGDPEWSDCEAEKND